MTRLNQSRIAAGEEGWLRQRGPWPGPGQGRRVDTIQAEGGATGPDPRGWSLSGLADRERMPAVRARVRPQGAVRFGVRYRSGAPPGQGASGDAGRCRPGEGLPPWRALFAPGLSDRLPREVSPTHEVSRPLATAQRRAEPVTPPGAGRDPRGRSDRARGAGYLDPSVAFPCPCFPVCSIGPRQGIGGGRTWWTMSRREPQPRRVVSQGRKKAARDGESARGQAPDRQSSPAPW